MFRAKSAFRLSDSTGARMMVGTPTRDGIGHPLSGKRLGPTHIHAFELNWSDTEQRMRESPLRFARDVEEELADFASLRKFIGNRFKINNIEIVTEPVWDYDLFQWGDADG